MKFRELPTDHAFWANKNIDDIENLLWVDLIVRTPSKRRFDHPNIESLLSAILQRTNNINAQTKSTPSKQMLRVQAMVSFYLGNYQEAASKAAILGQMYFNIHTTDVEDLSSHFNLIAGLAHMRGIEADTSHIVHHFKLYLHSKRTDYSTDPEIELMTLEYLLKNDSELNHADCKRMLDLCLIKVARSSKFIAYIQNIPLLAKDKTEEFLEINGFNNTNEFKAYCEALRDRSYALASLIAKKLLALETTNTDEFKKLNAKIEEAATSANTIGLFSSPDAAKIKYIYAIWKEVLTNVMFMEDGFKLILDEAKQSTGLLLLINNHINEIMNKREKNIIESRKIFMAHKLAPPDWMSKSKSVKNDKENHLPFASQ